MQPLPVPLPFLLGRPGTTLVCCHASNVIALLLLIKGYQFSLVPVLAVIQIVKLACEGQLLSVFLLSSAVNSYCPFYSFHSASASP